MTWHVGLVMYLTGQFWYQILDSNKNLSSRQFRWSNSSTQIITRNKMWETWLNLFTLFLNLFTPCTVNPRWFFHGTQKKNAKQLIVTSFHMQLLKWILRLNWTRIRFPIRPNFRSHFARWLEFLTLCTSPYLVCVIFWRVIFRLQKLF